MHLSKTVPFAVLTMSLLVGCPLTSFNPGGAAPNSAAPPAPAGSSNPSQAAAGTFSAGPYTVSTWVGNGNFSSKDGIGTAAEIFWPTGIAFDAAGTAYVSERGNNRIRKITPDGTVTTIAGQERAFADGHGSAASFWYPEAIAMGPDGNLYVSDSFNHRIRKVTPSGDVTTVAGGATHGSADGPVATATLDTPMSLLVDAAGTIFFTDRSTKIRKIENGTVTTLDWTKSFNNVGGMAWGPNNRLYCTDETGERIYYLDKATGTPTLLAGGGTYAHTFQDGVGEAARFYGPSSLVVDSQGNVLVSDAMNYRIRRVSATGTVTTVVGDGTAGFADGLGSSARISRYTSLAVSPAGQIYLCDGMNQRIRKLTAP